MANERNAKRMENRNHDLSNQQYITNTVQYMYLDERIKYSYSSLLSIHNTPNHYINEVKFSQ